MARHCSGTTALDELPGVDAGLVNGARLYRVLDRLGPHQDALWAYIKERYRPWFDVSFQFFFCDTVNGVRIPNPTHSAVGIIERPPRRATRAIGRRWFRYPQKLGHAPWRGNSWRFSD